MCWARFYCRYSWQPGETPADTPVMHCMIHRPERINIYARMLHYCCNSQFLVLVPASYRNARSVRPHPDTNDSMTFGRGLSPSMPGLKTVKYLIILRDIEANPAGENFR